MNFLNIPSAHQLTFKEQQGPVYRFEGACDQNSPGSFLHLPPRILHPGDLTANESGDIPWSMRFQRMVFNVGVEVLDSVEGVLDRLNSGDFTGSGGTSGGSGANLERWDTFIVYYEVHTPNYEPIGDFPPSPESPITFEIPPLDEWELVPPDDDYPELYVAPVVVSRGPGWGACAPIVDVLKEELPVYPDVEPGYEHISAEYFGSPASQRQKIRDAKVGDVVFPPYWRARWFGINVVWELHIGIKVMHDADVFGDPNPETFSGRAYSIDNSNDPPFMYWTDGGAIRYYYRPHYYGWDQWNEYEPFVFSDLCLLKSPHKWDGISHYNLPPHYLKVCASEEFHAEMGSDDLPSSQTGGCTKCQVVMSQVAVYAFWEPTPRKRKPVTGVANLTALGLLSGLALCGSGAACRTCRKLT